MSSTIAVTDGETTSALLFDRDEVEEVEDWLQAMIGSREREDDIAIIAVRVFAVAPRVLDLRLPSATGSLDVVRDSLRVWLGGVATRRAEAEEIVLAAWEACANAIEHAQDPGKDFVRLVATVADSRVRVVIEDTGRWSPQEDRPDRGLGLQLMSAPRILAIGRFSFARGRIRACRAPWAPPP